MIYGLKNSYLVNTVYFLVVCLLRREFDIKKMLFNGAVEE